MAASSTSSGMDLKKVKQQTIKLSDEEKYVVETFPRAILEASSKHTFAQAFFKHAEIENQNIKTYPFAFPEKI